jgi:hypothetical protein
LFEWLAFKIFIKWIFFEKTLPDLFTFLHHFLTLICVVKLYPDCKNEKQEYFEQKHFGGKVIRGERIYFYFFRCCGLSTAISWERGPLSSFVKTFFLFKTEFFIIIIA